MFTFSWRSIREVVASITAADHPDWGFCKFFFQFHKANAGMAHPTQALADTFPNLSPCPIPA